MFHQFTGSVSHIVLPEKFTYPFCYVPHPLCIAAAEELQAYIISQEQWAAELEHGKMFGVLVVKTKDGVLGFLAAFSGNLDGKNSIPYFVPSVYDMLRPDGFFKCEETEISAINHRIDDLEKDEEYKHCVDILSKEISLAKAEINAAKETYKLAKAERDERRKQSLSDYETAEMVRESQFQKAELRRLEQRWKTRLTGLQNEYDGFVCKIEELKHERKERSIRLQKRLFEHFRMLNARGETRDLCDIFEETVQKIPPSGAGECAAPKLLQYAYLNDLEPVCMAEFWWGNSPRGEIRRHGFYYPACRGKCEPILSFMLQGLDVDANPLEMNKAEGENLEIIYEDEWLLAVNKPAGMLSVPGKSDVVSVFGLLKEKYPDVAELMIVHRLDMDTSGILLVAKTKDVYLDLQKQFLKHTIRKQYFALLDGSVLSDEGKINLPLRMNPLDRPRQVVDVVHGKIAITEYKVLAHRDDGRTFVSFCPLTGRTHQLRVHAAYHEGLNAPIVGDNLYGKSADRLYLHAEHIEFCHPVTGKMICLDAKIDFLL